MLPWWLGQLLEARLAAAGSQICLNPKAEGVATVLADANFYHSSVLSPFVQLDPLSWYSYAKREYLLSEENLLQFLFTYLLAVLSPCIN